MAGILTHGLKCGTAYYNEDGELRVNVHTGYFSVLTDLLAQHMYKEFIEHPLFAEFVELISWDLDPTKYAMRHGIMLKLYVGTGRTFPGSRDYNDLLALYEAELAAPTTNDSVIPGVYTVEEGVGLLPMNTVVTQDFVPSSSYYDGSYMDINGYDGYDTSEFSSEDNFGVGMDPESTKVDYNSLLQYTRAHILVGADVATAYARDCGFYTHALETDPFKHGFCYLALMHNSSAALFLATYRYPPVRMDRQLYDNIAALFAMSNGWQSTSAAVRLFTRELHLIPVDFCNPDLVTIPTPVLWNAIPQYFSLLATGSKITWNDVERRFKPYNG